MFPQYQFLIHVWCFQATSLGVNIFWEHGIFFARRNALKSPYACSNCAANVGPWKTLSFTQHHPRSVHACMHYITLSSGGMICQVLCAKATNSIWRQHCMRLDTYTEKNTFNQVYRQGSACSHWFPYSKPRFTTCIEHHRITPTSKLEGQ